jgi:hypothetical protein
MNTLEISSNEAAAGQKLDVCLLLEGTYPYVRGGVSTWVHQIVSTMPDLNFGIVYLGSERKIRGEACYEMPENVRRFEHIFLFDDPSPNRKSSSSRARNANAVLRRTVRELLDNLAADSGVGSRLEEKSDAESDLRPVLLALATASRQAPEGFDEFWTHPDTWQIARDFYQQRLSNESFIDTVRTQPDSDTISTAIEVDYLAAEGHWHSPRRSAERLTMRSSATQLFWQGLRPIASV